MRQGCRALIAAVIDIVILTGDRYAARHIPVGAAEHHRLGGGQLIRRIRAVQQQTGLGRDGDGHGLQRTGIEYHRIAVRAAGLAHCRIAVCLDQTETRLIRVGHRHTARGNGQGGIGCIAAECMAQHQHRIIGPINTVRHTEHRYRLRLIPVVRREHQTGRLQP